MSIDLSKPELNFYPTSGEGSLTTASATAPTGSDVSTAPKADTLDPQPNSPTVPVSPTNIIPAPNGTIMNGGTMQSPNYSKGSSGWQIDSDGNVEFNDGTFRGALQANSIDIPDATTTNSFHVDSEGNTWWGATTFGAAPASVSKAGAATFTSITIGGYVQNTKGSFGGDGSDGALAISSGTTTIDLANAQTLVKNYTSISITGTGKLAFSNPHANGTYIILKSQGAVTLTSSSTPMLDASGLGGAGGAAVSSGAVFVAGNDGTAGVAPLFKTNFGVGSPTTNPSAAAGGAVPTFFYNSMSQVLNAYPQAFVGAGGGSGSANGLPTANNEVSGAGGNGGGSLVIECGGAWNFTTASGISVKGANGENAPNLNNTSDRAAGGGGGGGGYFLALYNSLTANSGTITATGGTGGNTAANLLGDSANNGGGGGGASATTAGSAGTNNVGAGNQSGGNGGAGISNVILNTIFT